MSQANKLLITKFYQALDAAAPDAVGDICTRRLAPDFRWHGGDPFGQTRTPATYARTFWEPIKTAIPDLARQTHIFMAGTSSAREGQAQDGTKWVAATGYFTGTATTPFLGIPVTDQVLRIRWGEFFRIDDGQITYAQTILDFVDWFDQIGHPVLPRPRGASHVYPAPTGHDGCLFAPQDDLTTRTTLGLGRDFIFGGLNAFDQTDLGSMGMAKFFHPNVKWYGPGGIGACLSLREFEDLHQQPWLIAFPNRKVMYLESLFAEDTMLAASGPRGVIATQTGPYLGHPPSGNRIEVSGIDFWRRDGDKFVENWVFVDMIHLFRQMGVDLFARLPQ